MIQLPELTNPATAKTIALIARAWAIGEAVYAAVTGDRAIAIYHSVIKTVLTAILLTIAAGMLTRQAVEALRQWFAAHQDEDFAKLATDKVEAVAATVKRVVKGQRDRASLLVQSTAADLEMQARAKVSQLGLAISDRALAQCGVEGCKR